MVDNGSVSAMLETVGDLLSEGNFAQALEYVEADMSLAPTAGHVCAMSAIAYHQGDLATAIRLLDTLVEGVEGPSDIPEILGVLNCLAGRVTEALYYGKLATAHPTNGELLPLFGGHFPAYATAFMSVEHKPFLVAARTLLNRGQVAQAITAIEQHLQLFNGDVEGLDCYSQCLALAGDHRQVVNTLRTVFTLAGPSATLSSRLGQALVALGAFEQGMASHRQAVARGPKAAVLWAGLVDGWRYFPWGACAARDEAVAGLAAAIAAAGPKVPRKAPVPVVRDLLTVGLLCRAVHSAEETATIARVAGAFDPARVRVVGFGPGELSDTVNNAFRGKIPVWRNTAKIDELTLATVVRGEGVDVLVDTDGLGAPDALGLMARNAAPLQYSWLRMPPDLTLPGGHGNLAGEPDLARVGALPLVAADAADGGPLPAQASGALTLGADVTLAELNSEVVRAWASILHALPSATLVLADHGFSDPQSSTALVELFGNFGVAHRIDVVAQADTQEFFRAVDVALVPFPVTRPLSYGTALSLGVPVIAMAGTDGLSPLVAAAGDCGTFVADDAAAYLERTLDLAGDLEGLARLRADLAVRVRGTAAFDPVAFAAGWESFFRDRLAAAAAMAQGDGQ